MNRTCISLLTSDRSVIGRNDHVVKGCCQWPFTPVHDSPSLEDPTVTDITGCALPELSDHAVAVIRDRQLVKELLTNVQSLDLTHKKSTLMFVTLILDALFITK